MASDRDEQADMTTHAIDDDANNTAKSSTPTTSTANEGNRVGEDATAEDAVRHRDNSEMMPAPPAPLSTSLNTEQLHILLNYSTLLALTRDTSRPVIDLNMEAQVRQLDAFLVGDVTEDGVATHWSAESKSFERLRRYEHLCNQLVPNLMAAIKKQSQINLKAEPKNCVDGDKNPEHQSFCELYLTPNLVTMYGKWVEKSRKKGINPDFDPWTDAVKYGKLIQLLQTIYEHQYDFTDWKHTRPKPVFNQAPRLKAEEFMRVMDNRDQIRVYHCITTPLGKVFSQLDTIPETAIKYTDKELGKMWRDKTRSKYLIPDPAAVTIPSKRRGMNWVNSDGVGKIWTRGEEIWSTKFKFMVFDRATNAYIHEHVVNENLLEQSDLNDETWVNRYRKKIAEWRVRVTGEVTKVCDHWNDEERTLMYEFSNAWVKKHGVDKFVPRIWESEKYGLTTTLVNKTGRARTTESTCAWARKQMTDKPNEPLGLLYAEGQKMVTRINAGGVVPDVERYPDEAINIADLLAKADSKRSDRHRKYGSEYSAKRKCDSDDESAGGDILNDSRNFNLDGESDRDADLAREAGDSNSDDDGPPSSSPIQSSKRLKVPSKGKKLFGRATGKEEATSAKPKRLTKTEMDARTAKHDTEAAGIEADIGDDNQGEFDMDFDSGRRQFKMPLSTRRGTRKHTAARCK